MSDNNEEPTTPEMTSFEITTQRKFEEDYSDQQIRALMEQTGADSPEAAVAQAVGQSEAGNISPTQKLIGIDVDVDGPSGD